MCDATLYPQAHLYIFVYLLNIFFSLLIVLLFAVFARKVLHGWFTDPQPFFTGGLSADEATDPLNLALEQVQYNDNLYFLRR